MVWFLKSFNGLVLVLVVGILYVRERDKSERVGRSNVQLRWSASCVKNIYRDWTPKNSCSFTYECIE